MTIFLGGIALFFLAHLILPRAAVRAQVGDVGVKLGVTAIAGVGLVLIILGYPDASLEPVYEPIEYSTARALAHGLMPIAILLVLAANFPKTNVKRFVAHPMMLGVLIWAAVHLAGNGDVRNVILFGSFGLYALLILFVLGGPLKKRDPAPILWDVGLVVATIGTYGFLIWAHRVIGGVAVVG